jgi:hypothetical protein
MRLLAVSLQHALSASQAYEPVEFLMALAYSAEAFIL